MKEGKEIPESWVEAPISELADFIRGVSYKKADARSSPAEGFIPVLRANNIDGQLNYEDLVYVPKKYVSKEKIVRHGDVVLAMSSGSRKIVGKAAQAKSPLACAFGAFCGVVRPNTTVVNPEYFGYYFQTREYRNMVSELSKGVNINNLKADHILDRILRLPPKTEQDRLTEKLDEFFSQIDDGEQALERVQKLLERYRQSVLKAAVTGELTRDWREKNKNSLESGEDLLKRILKARSLFGDELNGLIDEMNEVLGA